MSAPAILPLFRSERQLRIVATLFTGTDRPLTIAELANIADVTPVTASREVSRLAEHGLVVTETQGRNVLVSANWALPWAHELQSILIQTVGVLGSLSSALSNLKQIEAVYIYGSWASRYLGERGPAPRDIDVLVIGNVALRTVRNACKPVEDELRIELNPVVVTADRWNAQKPEPFITQLREHPLVEISLTR